MDREYRDFERESSFDPFEIVYRRTRAGLCAICASPNPSICTCIGSYLYNTTDGGFRFKRDKKSTLPFGVVIGVDEFKMLVYEIASREEREIEMAQIEDISLAVLQGVDIEDDERKNLGGYIAALDEAAGEF